MKLATFFPLTLAAVALVGAECKKALAPPSCDVTKRSDYPSGLNFGVERRCIAQATEPSPWDGDSDNEGTLNSKDSTTSIASENSIPSHPAVSPGSSSVDGTKSTDSEAKNIKRDKPTDFATATSSGTSNYSSVVENLCSALDKIFKEHKNATDILLLSDILNRLVKLQEEAAKPSDPWSSYAIYGAGIAGAGLVINLIVTFFIGISNFMKDKIVKSPGWMSRFVRYLTGWTDTAPATDDLKRRIDELEAFIVGHVDLLGTGTLVRRSMLARMDDFDVALNGLFGTADAPGRMGQAEADLVTATTNITALSGRINRATNGAHTANSRLATVSANVIALGVRIDTLGTSLNSLSARFDTGTTNFVQLSSDVANVEANIIVLKGSVKTNRSGIVRLEKNVDQGSSKADSAKVDLPTLSSRMTTANAKLSGFLSGFLGSVDVLDSSGRIDFGGASLAGIDERIKKLQSDFREHESQPAGMAHVCV
ncbi:hypothetical protein CKAH01_17555 [Colletotrichum kahawae]|uniref:Uncharacterized protein n=1 Tax=Colletotrichum kahawae TaxID=34407 RepID=A0AAD9Y9Y5_COLKA|nr:hypothetical protein CKAH01_17555 [Colletotrichum kahawae]